jgi:DNA-binding CsgD family transcriptional regulator
VVLRGPAGIGKTTAALQVVRGHEHRVGQSLPSMTGRHHRPLEHALRCSLPGDPEIVAVDVASRLDGGILLLEDLQWADGATLEVLQRLVGAVPMLATTRADDPFHGDVMRIDVPPLSARASYALLRRTRPDLSHAAAARVIALANGNPLLLTHLDPDDRGRQLSPSLVEAVRSGIDGRTAEERSMLSVLAAYGRPAPAELLGTQTAVAPFTSVDADGAIWFTHDLFREGVIDLMTDDDWQAAHATLADRTDGADAAAHLLALGRSIEAADLAESAAESAFGPERAHLLLLAVEARGNTADVALRLDAAHALLAVHRPADALDVLEQLEPDDKEQAATTLWSRARAAWMQGDASASAEMLDAGLELVAGTRTPIEAHLTVERVSIAIRERPGDERLADEVAQALELAEQAGVDQARAHSLAGRALAHSFRDGWRDHYRRAADVARAERDPDQECAARYWEISALGFFGPLEEALSVGRSLVDRSAELGQIVWHHLAVTVLGLHQSISGRLTSDMPDRLESLLRSDPNFRNRSQARLALVAAHLDLGDHVRAGHHLSALREEARSDDDRSLCFVAEAMVAEAEGDAAAMEAVLGGLADIPVGFFGLKVLAESSAIHLHLRNEAELPDLPRYSALCPPILWVIGVERSAYDDARSGRPADAAVAFEALVGECISAGGPRWAARAWASAAACWTRADQPDRATHALDRSAELCRQQGYRSLEATAVDARRRLATAIAQSLLTPRELEVLRGVARGATTAEIAREHGVATSTVDSQVSSARRKLGARTRRQAAAMVMGQ